jgi:hypothetical protein
MHFASELPLSQGCHSMHMDSQEMIIQANPGSTRKKWGKSWKYTLVVPLAHILYSSTFVMILRGRIGVTHDYAYTISTTFAQGETIAER